MTTRTPPSVSEKNLPQSTIVQVPDRMALSVYQKRTCRNLQSKACPTNLYEQCIRKEPAAIYNISEMGHLPSRSVSEKNLPQSTIRRIILDLLDQVYQKRTCRNLQCVDSVLQCNLKCIRKEPAAIYNRYQLSVMDTGSVSEKNLPQSTIG